MDEHISRWIQHISQPRPELGGMPVCPYAANSGYKIETVSGPDIDPPVQDFELIIYKLPDELTVDQVIDLARQLNVSRPDLIFLPDPRDRHTDINGVPTNNGHFNLILCQPRDRLIQARARLDVTQYYTYWDPDYLDEIMSA